MLEDDTIVAVATPAGASPRAIVRLSGPEAFAVLASRLDTPRRGRVHAAGLRLRGEAALPGLVAWMAAPRTYTREDVTEFHTFGSPPLLREAVSILVEAGARLALPGEFTRRAFRNGRIDLTQAEAVLALVSARTEAERHSAAESLQGGFGRSVEAVKDAALNLLALIEAALDFSDQDIEIVSDVEVRRRLAGLRDAVSSLDRSHAQRPAAGEWPRVVLCGPANAGKSSLLNALAGRERAIVTEVAGTTLDVVEAEVVLSAGRVVLVDTPGFLEAAPERPLEAEAARRAREHLRSAALCLWVVDASLPASERESALREGRAALEEVGVVGWLDVFNKIDLALAGEPRVDPGAPLRVSARTGEGLSALRESIAARAFDALSPPALAAAARHGALLARARGAIDRGLQALAEGRPVEVVAVDLRDSLDALGEITGAVSTEDLLGRIFSQFCIGK